MLDRRELMRHTLFLVGASLGAAALPGCAPRAAEQYFTRRRRALLDEVAELTIPQTDTPGARAAGVGASVDRMLAQWASPETQIAFDQVLDDIDAKARDMHGAALLDLAPAPRLAVLTAFDAEQMQTPGAPPMLGAGSPPAYTRFKELVLTAYYLSEPGATQELRLEPVPGPWRGDIPLSEVGRAWAY